MNEEADREARRAARANWPGAIYQLGEEPLDNPIVASPGELMEMVTMLTARCWALWGLPIPQFKRSELPGRVTHDGL